jgi:CheY-like chemotaxis protein
MGRPARVLVVDKRPEDAELYETGLAFLGYNVSTARDAQSAIRTAIASQPDAIVLHLGAPEAAGWETCDALRRVSTTGSIPIIILSAFVDKGHRDRARATLNCAAFVGHPCTYEDLHAVIMRVLAGERGVEWATGTLDR